MGERGGPEQSWIGTASMAGLATREKKNINKRSTLAGYVLEYGRFYGGVGTTDRGWYVQYIWNTQNLERLGRGTGIRSAQNIPGQMDRGEFQKNKPTKRIYMHGYSEYKMVATEEPSTHSGSVAILYRAEENFSVESLHTYGPNVVSFQMASGDKWWYIAGYYLDPDDASTIEDIFTAIRKQPQGDALLVVGDFKTNLAAPEGRERN